jgi:hypothetical protein
MKAQWSLHTSYSGRYSDKLCTVRVRSNQYLYEVSVIPPLSIYRPAADEVSPANKPMLVRMEEGEWGVLRAVGVLYEQLEPTPGRPAYSDSEAL